MLVYRPQALVSFKKYMPPPLPRHLFHSKNICPLLFLNLVRKRRGHIFFEWNKCLWYRRWKKQTSNFNLEGRSSWRTAITFSSSISLLVIITGTCTRDSHPFFFSKTTKSCILSFSNLIKIRSPHLLPIFCLLFFYRRVCRD